MLKIEQFKNINKDDRVLVIVESPNKVKTISQFLPKANFVVKATVGHIYKIADGGDYNMGINLRTFEPDYQLMDGKDKLIKELKQWVDKCNLVILASDDDNEGELISEHVKKALKLTKKQYIRCTFHEITEKAVLEAINNPRDINSNIADSAKGRGCLDKIVGYRLSPISRKSINARSVGRCQSAALRLIVDREEEIQNFDSKQFYEIWLSFLKNKKEYKAQYKGLLKATKNTPTIESEEAADKIINDCKGKDFIVESIISKDRKVSPKPPFITATFQQEASSKLGYAVKKSQECAQRLFEGIELGNKHVALITYIRTDSTSMNPEFEESLSDYIKDTYGKDYFGGKRKTKKAKGTQDGHECIRVIDLGMTPDKLSKYITDSQLLKVYSLIYARTVASMMSDAVITDTEYTIKCDKYKFIYTEHNVKFPGWRIAYGQYDDEEVTAHIDLKEKEKINDKLLEKLKKKTSPPARYTEASLIKKLTDLQIGRPSTYSTIVSILLDPKRGYCTESGKSITPTELGINLVHFLVENFNSLFTYDYSAKLEEELDQIATGKIDRVDFLKEFYSSLEEIIKKAPNIKVVTQTTDKTCSECGSPLVVRKSRYGLFLGCSSYPKCKHTEKLESN